GAGSSGASRHHWASVRSVGNRRGGHGAAAGIGGPRRVGAAGRWWRWHARAMSGIDNDDFDALLGPPATPAQRRRQQASQAGFDHAVGLVEQAAKAASISDQAALDAAVGGMEQVAFDDFEQRHPPSAALDYLLYDVVCDLVPTITPPASARPGGTTSSSTAIVTLPRALPGGYGWWSA